MAMKSENHYPQQLTGERAGRAESMAVIRHPEAAMGSELRDLAAFKRLLGETANDYTDAQIEEIQREMFALAEILIGLYECKRTQSKAAQGRRERLGAVDSAQCES
jgi:hypothetical protein